MNQPRSVMPCYYFFFLVVLSVLVTCEAQGIDTSRQCPANEVYLNCGANCQTECATLGERCLIVHKRCPDGCYCNEGYARDSTGRCVPLNQCRKYNN